jgi:hypothetical protein
MLAAGGVGGVCIPVLRLIWKPALSLFTNRAERDERKLRAEIAASAKVETARLEKEAVIEAARINAAVARDDQEVTGRHAMVGEWQEYARQIRSDLSQVKEQHSVCAKDLAEMRRQVDAWEDRASGMEVTFQDVKRQGEECEKGRASDRARITELESQVQAIRRTSPPTGMPATKPPK